MYILTNRYIQVYLVAGGWDGPNDLFPTEILHEGSSQWTEVEPLPAPINRLKGISLNNKIIMTGNIASSIIQAQFEMYLYYRWRVPYDWPGQYSQF